MYYTEYLPRINSISIVLDFNESVSKITNLLIKDLNKLIIKTDKDEYCIALPIELESNQIRITKLNQSSGCLTITIALPITTENNQTIDKTKSFVNSSVLKWSCQDLKNKTPKDTKSFNKFSFNCLNCCTELVNSKDYKFLDMPSEYWYEMMDFWHCHKPNSNDSNYNKKNYNGKLKPSNNDIIIGNYYLLLDNNNENRKYNVSIDNSISCFNCKNKLGEVDANNLKLFKWNLSLNYNRSKESFPTYLYVYNLIIDKINLSAIRKFKFKLDQGSLFVWIVSIGVNISINDKILNNSLKILYHESINKNDDDDINDEAIERLKLSNDIAENVLLELNKINLQLPSSNRFLTIKEGEGLKKYNLSYLSCI